MKKFMALVMAGVTLLGVTGCGTQNGKDANDVSSASGISAESTDNSASNKSSDTTPSSDTSTTSDSSTESDTEEMSNSDIPFETATVSISETAMDYLKFGTGDKTFVIIPGLSIHSVLGSAQAIANAYAAFTDEYTVYLFDRPKDIPEDCTIRDLADDTAAAMQSLSIEGADVFGASMGGMTAQYIAIDHPALVNKMVLGSTLARPNATSENIMKEWISLAEAKDENALLASFADNIYSEATLEAYRDTIISSNEGISDEEYERFITLANACLSFDCYDELSSIKCPILVIGSKGDKVLTAEGSTEIADALGCEIYLYDENYGHGVYDEAPDYVQRCLDFFAE